jgi:LPXTG-motif cell wall-anchored protein
VGTGKRLVALVGLAFVAIGGATAHALPPIGNDHVSVTAAFSCAADGTQTVTWTIQQFAHNAPVDITSWATSPDASTPLVTTLPPLGSTTATATVTPGSSTQHADITATFPASGRVDTQSIDVTVPPCVPTTTTPTTAATTTTDAGVGQQGSTTTAGSSSSVSPTTAGTLPFTGTSSSTPLLAVGVGLAGVGGMLLGITRKRRAH